MPAYPYNSYSYDPYDNPAMDLRTYEEMNPNVDPYFYYSVPMYVP
jgi:hypothetical protein